MSRQLFIALYLDEDVDVLIAKLIQARAFIAMTTHDADQLGKTDAEQLQFATSRGLALVTHNRADFEQLARQYSQTGQRHSGMLIAT